MKLKQPKKSMKDDNKKALYKGFALVNRPSNEFFILFRANRKDVEDIAEKIIPIRGNLEIIEVQVKEI